VLRDRAVPIWGRAEPGRGVQVEVDGHVVETVTRASGDGLVRLDPHAAGGPHRITIRTAAGDERVTTSSSARSGSAPGSRTCA